MPYGLKYKLKENLFFQTQIKGYDYQIVYGDFVSEIQSNGVVIVSKGFLSDGNSPKFSTPFGSYGIPDGPLDLITGRPVTANAFFLHDALIRLNRKGKLNIPYQLIHKEYCNEISKTSFFLKGFYCFMVKLLGPRK